MITKRKRYKGAPNWDDLSNTFIELAFTRIVENETDRNAEHRQ